MITGEGLKFEPLLGSKLDPHGVFALNNELQRKYGDIRTLNLH